MVLFGIPNKKLAIDNVQSYNNPRTVPVEDRWWYNLDHVRLKRWIYNCNFSSEYFACFGEMSNPFSIQLFLTLNINRIFFCIFSHMWDRFKPQGFGIIRTIQVYKFVLYIQILLAKLIWKLQQILQYIDRFGNELPGATLGVKILLAKLIGKF